MTGRCVPRGVPSDDERIAGAYRRATAYEGALADVERLLRVIAMATRDEQPEAISADDAAALHFVVNRALAEIAAAWREAEPC